MSKLTIIQGDLTMMPLRGGAIVNPSNTGMVLTSRGINQQITRRAGPFMQQTMHTARSRLRGGRLDPGTAIATDAGQLQVEKLIHVAIVGARKINKRLIGRCLLSAYDLADELELTQVGVPPLGPGISKFPFEDFVEVFWQITAEELPRLEHVHHVVLAAQTEHEFEYLKAYAAEHGDDMEEEEIEMSVSSDGITMSTFSAGFQ
jgi:O-acetyl-ADP-ribose deacetylase (regulator of RNase III)